MPFLAPIEIYTANSRFLKVHQNFLWILDSVSTRLLLLCLPTVMSEMISVLYHINIPALCCWRFCLKFEVLVSFSEFVQEI